MGRGREGVRGSAEGGAAGRHRRRGAPGGSDFQSADPAKHIAAVDLFANAVKGITEAKEFRNPSSAPAKFAAPSRLAISALLKDGAFEAAVKATDAYAAVCEAGATANAGPRTRGAGPQHSRKAGGDYKPKALAAADEYKGLVAAATGGDGEG